MPPPHHSTLDSTFAEVRVDDVIANILGIDAPLQNLILFKVKMEGQENGRDHLHEHRKSKLVINLFNLMSKPKVFFYTHIYVCFPETTTREVLFKVTIS